MVSIRINELRFSSARQWWQRNRKGGLLTIERSNSEMIRSGWLPQVSAESGLRPVSMRIQGDCVSPFDEQP